MIKVILDTSNQYLVVALYKDDKCLGKIQELGSQRQSENAIPYLQKLLEENHIDLLEDEITGPLHKIYKSNSFSVSTKNLYLDSFICNSSPIFLMLFS